MEMIQYVLLCWMMAISIVVLFLYIVLFVNVNWVALYYTALFRVCTVYCIIPCTITGK